MSVELYAPTVFKALNGVFCVYKPPGLSVFKLVDILRINLARGTITTHLTLWCAMSALCTVNHFSLLYRRHTHTHVL